MHIVIVSHVPFKQEIGTPYHLAVAFANHVPVTYIAPASGWIAEWRMRKLALQNRLRVRVITPLLPGGLRFLPKRTRARWIRLSSLLTLSLQLRPLRQHSSQSIVLWGFPAPVVLDIQRCLRPQLFCYHRLDDFTAMDDANRVLEDTLHNQADLVFAVAENLVHHDHKSKTLFLRNGVNIELFARAWQESTPLPPELATIPSPRIGYVGAIVPDWVDIELVYELAERHPEWSFVLVGPKIRWHPPDQSPANLHLLGARPYQSLPDYLRGFDVCLIPFKDNPITWGASPLKLYEYLAAGRAVVSVPFSDAKELPEGIVWWTQGVQGFESAIREALKTAHDPLARQQRVAAVQPHTWEARAQTALQHIQEALKAKQSTLNAPDRC